MDRVILTERQIKFLELFGNERTLSSSFYFTGGTPLAEFYLQHRYSEDLDFFSEHEFDISGVNIFLKKIQPTLQFKTFDYQQSYNRNLFFLDFGDEILKLEFTYFPFTRIDDSMTKFNLSVDSILDIAVNKLFTIYQRTKARDYIDLYFICNKYDFSVSDLIAKARLKFDWHIDPIQLGAQFIKAEIAEDMPRMIDSIDMNLVASFFAQEAKRLKDQIIEAP